MLAAIKSSAGAQIMLLSAIMALTAACGGTPSSPEDSVPTSAPTPTAQPTVEPSPSPSPTPPPETPPPSATESSSRSGAYDSTANMFSLYSGPRQKILGAFDAMEEARENSDKSMVPVIVEMMRFVPSRDLWAAAAKTLTELTGQDIGPDWSKWVEWLGPNLQEYQPPVRYLEWKINLLAVIDPRYREFLSGADKTALIDLTELLWGGQPPDRIRDLVNPPHVDPDDQDYMRPDDRVFGVSINGEHRAYPLRIVNPHEMANDFLGGEPIALAY